MLPLDLVLAQFVFVQKKMVRRKKRSFCGKKKAPVELDHQILEGLEELVGVVISGVGIPGFQEILLHAVVVLSATRTQVALGVLEQIVRTELDHVVLAVLRVLEHYHNRKNSRHQLRWKTKDGQKISVRSKQKRLQYTCFSGQNSTPKRRTKRKNMSKSEFAPCHLNSVPSSSWSPAARHALCPSAHRAGRKRVTQQLENRIFAPGLESPLKKEWLDRLK